MAKLDIISIGDATEDVFLQLEEAELHCSNKTGKCELCMEFATKLPISRVDKLVGGNSSNLSIGMARLGFKAGFYVELGKDEQGEKIIRLQKKDGVNMKYARQTKGVSTNYSVVLNKGAERTILIYHVPRKYKLPKFEKVDWIYYSSMGKGFEKIHKELVKYLDRTGAKLGFNPGTHQMRAGRKMNPFYKRSKVLFLNKEEVQLVTKKKTGDIKKLLIAEKKLGPEIAVLTDGPAGSYAYDGKNFWFQDIYDVPVIERTGCGDSYSTGFMAALMRGLDIKEAMRWGTMNAAFVIQQIGPQAGLLKLDKMQRMLKHHPDFHPVPMK